MFAHRIIGNDHSLRYQHHIVYQTNRGRGRRQSSPTPATTYGLHRRGTAELSASLPVFAVVEVVALSNRTWTTTTVIAAIVAETL